MGQRKPAECRCGSANQHQSRQWHHCIETVNDDHSPRWWTKRWQQIDAKNHRKQDKVVRYISPVLPLNPVSGWQLSVQTITLAYFLMLHIPNRVRN